MSRSSIHNQAIARMHPWSRVAAGGIGAAAIALSVFLYFRPPCWRLPAEPPIGVLRVQSDPTAFCTALLTAGSVLLIIAANGRRVSKFGSDGVEFAAPSDQDILEDERSAQPLVAAPATVAAGTHLVAPSQTPIPPARGASRSFQQGGSTYHVYRPTDVPADALHAAATAFPTLVQTPADLAYAFSKTTDQGTDWFLRTRAGQSLRL